MRAPSPGTAVRPSGVCRDDPLADLRLQAGPLLREPSRLGRVVGDKPDRLVGAGLLGRPRLLGARAGADLGGRPRCWPAANESGCNRDLWLKLADLRRAGHPEDAAAVYRRRVEDVIGGEDKRAYAEAVRLIDETMRELFAESGRPEDFDAYVEEVRTAHKLKRNLMKLMAGREPASAPTPLDLERSEPPGGQFVPEEEPRPVTADLQQCYQ